MRNLSLRNIGQVLFLLALLLSSATAIAVEPVNTTFFGNTAIKGYDPVAYFIEDEAIKGSKEHVFTWRGAEWRFSSAENLEAFKEEPEKYAPQYGGYCAYAVSQGETANIDPSQFTVYNGKLYLNFNKKINKKWVADKEAYIRDADGNWPDLLEK